MKGGNTLRNIGVAQRRALIALAEAPEGVGEVPLMSAPGLINRGLARSLGRVSAKRNAAYVCQITEAGRALAASIDAPEGQPPHASGRGAHGSGGTGM